MLIASLAYFNYCFYLIENFRRKKNSKNFEAVHFPAKYLLKKREGKSKKKERA